MARDWPLVKVAKPTEVQFDAEHRCQAMVLMAELTLSS